MRFEQIPLYPKRLIRVPLHIKVILAAIVFVTPLAVRGTDPAVPYEQDFLITGYYSPQAGQCCYVKGGERADKILNGEGYAGADGTPVYPGMIAAPPSYPFGTRIVLEGIGTFEVNDRGGAIQELADGVHRLDVWTGHGEEGLSRALALGLHDVRGTVYPPGTHQPAISFALEDLPAPVERLEKYLIHGDNLMAMKAELGQKGLSVALLQDRLKQIGYFDNASTGYFGPETHESLSAFIRDFALSEETNRLTPTTAAYLQAAVKRGMPDAPISAMVDTASSEKETAEAQRTLRFLGYYKGRTDGKYSDALFQAILRFQQDHGLVGDSSSPGAGRIGPLTVKALRKIWNKHLVADRAQRHLLFGSVGQKLDDSGRLPQSFMGMDYNGSQVRLVQTLLADRGFFPAEKINGNFGPLTKDAVLRYQLDRGIVSSAGQNGAGYVGPSTLATLRKEEQLKYYRLVRAEGWKAL